MTAPTFEEFCKKYGLDPEQMNRGGGMWARVAIEDWQKSEDKAQPVACEPMLLLNGYQLRDALIFVAPDGTDEQLESEVCIQHGPERTDDEGTEAAGMYCWLSDYPEEGSVRLDDEPPGLLRDVLKARHPTAEIAPQPPAEQGAELSDEQLHTMAVLMLGRIVAEKYRPDLCRLMRVVIAEDRAAHGGQ